MSSHATSLSKKRPIDGVTNESQHQKRPSDDNASSLLSSQDLPVHKYKSQLLQALTSSKDDRVVLIVAETASGKSTQIPAYVMQATSMRIAVTQPRRVAAITLAQRVALETQSQQHPQHSSSTTTSSSTAAVGYRVRFEDTTTHETQLVYVTDGMLLREAMVDPLLKKYNIVFLDEAHERSLQTDILLGVVLRARKARHTANLHPLRVAIMSATLDVQVFRDFFGDDQVQLISIPGRQHFVQCLYTSEPVEDYTEAALFTVCEICKQEADGDVLVFLPGQEEIEDMATMLKQQLQPDKTSSEAYAGKDRFESMHPSSSSAFANNGHVVGTVMITLLYAALPPEAQMAAFLPKPKHVTRRVILATTIAETSITLPDIRYVVDTGTHKCRQVIPSTGMETLSVQDISQAQAKQRSGRAGRVQEGLCFRLYPQSAFESLQATSTPEISRVNLAQVVLQLKGMGISDVQSFEFVTPPNKTSLKRAMKQLYILTALDDTMELTEHGKKLAKLPLDPLFGNLLLKSDEYACVSDMLTTVAMLSAENLFYRPPGESTMAVKASTSHKRFASYEGDLLTCWNVYDAWRKEAVYVPPGGHGRHKVKHKHGASLGGSSSHAVKIPHGDWCQRNFISGRALVRAFNVRQQLRALCEKPLAQNGLGIDVTSSCGSNREVFLKCAAAGLFLQAASRVKTELTVDSSRYGGRSGSLSTSSNRGKYLTKVGNEAVSIHPTSTMFGRNPAPSCVVYTELIHTKRSYIRGVSQIRPEWLEEVAPQFYSS